MIDVACAVIFDIRNYVLVVKRSSTMPLPLKWEFPGGKIEAGESAESCLHREIMEELHVHIGITSSLSPVIYAYPGQTIRLLPFTCTIVSGNVQLLEHDSYTWLPVGKLPQLDWAPADIPIVQNLSGKS